LGLYLLNHQLSMKNSKIAGCSSLFSGRRAWQKARLSAGKLHLLAVLALYLTAISACPGLFAVRRHGFERFEPDLGGGKAERLNWLSSKDRWRKTRSHRLISERV
jgi:hypothetical protein